MLKIISPQKWRLFITLYCVLHFTTCSWWYKYYCVWAAFEQHMGSEQLLDNNNSLSWLQFGIQFRQCHILTCCELPFHFITPQIMNLFSWCSFILNLINNTYREQHAKNKSENRFVSRWKIIRHKNIWVQIVFLFISNWNITPL